MINIRDKNVNTIFAEMEDMDWVDNMCFITDAGNPVVMDVHTRRPALEAFENWLTSQPRDEKELAQSTGICIYGLGGWHRYYVLGTGEVVFSVKHSHEVAQKKATAAGFTLFR